MSIVVLPNELILTIFGFVDRRAVVMTVAAVSRQWRTVAAWLVMVDLTWAKESIDDAGLAGLARKFPNLVHLHLKDEDRATDAGLRSILAGCPNLESIGCIKDGACSVVIMNWFAGRPSPSLRSLRLYNTHVHRVATLRDITQHCPNLTRLDLMWTFLGDDGITVIVAGCRNLVRLNVSVTRVSDAGVTAIGAGCPKLTHLDLSLTQTRDDGLKAIGAGCPNLVDLGLQFDDRVGDDGITAIAKGCPNLQRLDLRWCDRVSDSGLKAIAKGCPHLTHLDARCEHVTRGGVEAVVAACSRVVVRHDVDGID